MDSVVILIKNLLKIIASMAYVGALNAAEHIPIRNIMIESQMTQVEKKAVLVVGDSIIESWLVSSPSTCQVINAGLGGGGVREVIALLSKLEEKKTGARLGGIIVAIGVNDSQRRNPPPLPSYLNDWKKEYESMVQIAKRLHPNLTVSTILPVEDGMPLGSNYFDKSIIDSMNLYIRKIAIEKNLHIVDLNMYFQKKVKKGFTIDGVHLTGGAYKYFNQQMISAFPEDCR